MKRGLSIGEHMNNYTKFLTDLVNVDVEIEEEDNTVILLNSLSDEEYETFVITLINDKQTLNYSYVSTALVMKKNEQSSLKSDSTEALMVRDKSFSKKGKGDLWEIEVQTDFQRSEEEPVRLLQRVMALKD